MIRKIIIVVLTLAALLCVLGWIVAVGIRSGLDPNYVPSSSEVLRWHSGSPFLRDATEIRGHYGNEDVPSIVYSYRTTMTLPAKFWEAIDSAVKKSDWLLAEVENGVRVYHKYEWRGEVRIALVESSSRVVVATSIDPKWAERVVRPKFEELLRSER